MGTSRVVREDVASYPRWKVISRSTARKLWGDVLEERNTETFCARTGCFDTRTLGPWGAVKFGSTLEGAVVGGEEEASWLLSSDFFSSCMMDAVVIFYCRIVCFC